MEVTKVYTPGSDEGQQSPAVEQENGGENPIIPDQENGNQGGGEENLNPPNPAEQNAEPDYSWLEDVSGGSIKDKEQLAHALKDYQQLKTASQEPQEPKFPNEAAKKVYEFALGYAGKEMDAVNKYFQVQSIDLEKADGRQKLFTKFMLDNPNLEQDRALKIFNADMEERFPEDSMEDNELLKFNFEKEVNNATSELAKLQKEYNEALQQNQDDGKAQGNDELVKMINDELPKFKGIQMSATIDEKGQISFGEADQKDPLNNVSFDIPQDKMNDFKAALEDPTKFWQNMILNEQGQVDPGKYMQNMFNLMFGNDIQKVIGGNLYARGKADTLKELKGINHNEPRGSQSQPHSNPVVAGIEEAKRRQGLI